MQTEGKQGQVYAHALQWLEACGDAAKRKTAALTQHDLAKLEECVVEEENLVSQYAALKAAAQFAGAAKSDVSLAQVRESLASLAVTVSSLNRLNAVLVATGMDFSRTLLSVMRPPLTYSQVRQGGASICVAPGRATLSLEC